jgi:transposase
MAMPRRQHRAEFKAKVAVEAIRWDRTMNELATEYGVHPVQITQWKKVVLEALPKLFASRRGATPKEEEALKAALYQQIGQLKVELDWLKKKVGYLRCGETPVDGAGASSGEPPSPMHFTGVGQGESVLSACQRARGEPPADAVTR